MNPFLVLARLTVAVLIAIGLYRVWAGPTVFDRLIAVALVSVNGVVVLVLLGIALERPVLLFDIALGFALLAFLLPITLGRYFEARLDRDIVEGGVSTRDTPTTHTAPHGLLADRGRALEQRLGQRVRRQAAATRQQSLSRGVAERRQAAEDTARDDAERQAAEDTARDDAERQAAEEAGDTSPPEDRP
jgi:multicomponent Na+:H+ antiporter subunit F